MNANLLRPGALQLQSSVTKTSTYTATAVEIPLAESFTFILDVTAASGTTPTLDVSIQVTPDNGTTWYVAAKFAQVTAVTTRRIQIQPAMGRGEAGTEGAITTATGALNANTIITKKIRTVWTIGGTNPSFTAVIWLLFIPRQANYA